MTALVTAGGTVLGALISGIVALLVSKHQHNKTIALIEYRLEQIEKKQDKYNNLIERTFIVETQVDDIKDDIKELKGH